MSCDLSTERKIPSRKRVGISRSEQVENFHTFVE
jgi:hypothetical protein